MEILLFGQLAEITGSNIIEVEGCSDTGLLQGLLETKYPGLRDVKYAIAINKKLIQSNTVLAGGESIALLPPFSGG